MKSRLICTHGRRRFESYRTRSGNDILIVRQCGRRAVTIIEGCPACAKHARNPKAA